MPQYPHHLSLECGVPQVRSDTVRHGQNHATPKARELKFVTMFSEACLVVSDMQQSRGRSCYPTIADSLKNSNQVSPATLTLTRQKQVLKLRCIPPIVICITSHWMSYSCHSAHKMNMLYVDLRVTFGQPSIFVADSAACAEEISTKHTICGSFY